MNDEYFMKRAIALARRGKGRTSPNPLVGAVIVKGGRIIGEGYHQTAGGPHAEINALARTGESAEGATVYVNLEPCCHYGKTPPCVPGLAAAAPARVVIGMMDPNPLVAGRGIEELKALGIETTVGVLEKECRALNEVFLKYITTGLPFVTLKFAQTLDGRIAAQNGDSRWVSSPGARRYVHRLRSLHDGILVGSGTVRQDDPELTVRLVRGKNPLRIVTASRLSLPREARVLKGQDQAKTLIATTDRAEGNREALADQGIEILTLPATEEGKVDLFALLQALGKRGISSLLVEGGAGIITSFLAAGLVDRIVAIIAPKILGNGISAVGNLGMDRMGNALPLQISQVKRIGGDLIVLAWPERV